MTFFLECYILAKDTKKKIAIYLAVLNYFSPAICIGFRTFGEAYTKFIVRAERLSLTFRVALLVRKISFF
jgi:hypothetical protein